MHEDSEGSSIKELGRNERDEQAAPASLSKFAYEMCVGRRFVVFWFVVFNWFARFCRWTFRTDGSRFRLYLRFRFVDFRLVGLRFRSMS